jgi:hypothetical protein
MSFMIMLALDVVLDFRCCICNHDMGVTLKCEGKGLASGLDTVACIAVACPTCCNNNLIYFTPGGALHRVAPDRKRFEFPEPSLN